jgi:hypothetical protein
MKNMGVNADERGEDIFLWLVFGLFFGVPIFLLFGPTWMLAKLYVSFAFDKSELSESLSKT